VIDKGTEVAEKHPEYLVSGLDGKPHVINEGKSYVLDITHPGARDWLRNLFDTVANKWGYDFIKIDFVEWSLLSASRYHDPSISRAQAYRRGFQTIREAIGPHRHLLDCGPSQNTVGILDSVRIELDLAALTWDQYSAHFFSNAPAAAKRYYFHGRTWINDDDHLGLALLTLPQAQAAATIIAMSGGTMISGDRLVDLDPARLEILRKVLPSYGVAARPMDLFRNPYPRIFTLPIRRPFEEWLLLAVFNYDAKSPLVEQIKLSDLGLDASKSYLAFEFWTQDLLGDVRDVLNLNVNPSMVQLIALREAKPHPQILSTSRHFTQGAIDLETAEWREPELRGVLRGEAGTSNEMFIRIPEGYRFDPPELSPSSFDADYDSKKLYRLSGYTAILLGREMLRLQFQFEQAESRAFSVKFAKTHAQP
jgi:hypothetical protein